VHHLQCLKDFIAAQMAYYARCNQLMAEWNHELAVSVICHCDFQLFIY